MLPLSPTRRSAPLADAGFGAHAPSARLGRLIRLAQSAPRNWLGQQFAQLVRALVLRRHTLPLDVAVGRLRLRCWLRDNHSERKFVFMPWRFDAEERRLIVQALGPDGTFVDIGANVGLYTLDIATQLGPRGRVLALEPHPPTFERLRFNVQATLADRPDGPRVQIERLGVHDAGGELRLHLDPGNLGGSSLLPRGRSGADAGAAARPEAPVSTVSCRPLAQILDAQGIERVDAIKIDIEGAEDSALMDYLRHQPEARLPVCLVIENSEHLWRQDLPAALHARGFRPQHRSRLNTVYCRARAPA